MLLLPDNEDYEAFVFVEEDDNFPGYVKLSLAEVKKTYLILSYFMIMIDDKLYLSNSMAMHFLNEPLDKSWNYTSILFALHQIFDECQKGI